ncbi:MAG: hypothetical protein HND57_16475 [Planctomycetes bacterium]|nr:hypothetical protein [Planctomycetota bacterium]
MSLMSLGGCTTSKDDGTSQEPNPSAAEPSDSSEMGHVGGGDGTSSDSAANQNPNGNGNGNGGSKPATETNGGQGPAPDAVAPAWPFAPTAVRIHPLSHYVPDDPTEGRVLRVRLEFSDRYGHTTKCIGRVVLQLFRNEALSATGRVVVPADAEPLGVWTFDLSDLAVNIERYDEVTQTYLVPVKPPADLELPSVGIIVARVQCLNGTLVDQSYVRFTSAPQP